MENKPKIKNNPGERAAPGGGAKAPIPGNTVAANLDAQAMREAMVMAEIIGPPVSKRHIRRWP